ncbi:hypothetical protein NQ318_009153 [Aromia moschata]|uniref:DDE Tnp4 domain-containing protein n=1 Tax=Aromia moschata TaxID=1265417 RepID=A0AAV8XFJ4_9CUCU|nr:hypothetical protein NQ318_009153 [Aromia moschata]
MEELVLNELLDEHIDLNIVGQIVNNLIQPANFVGPPRVPAIRNHDYYEYVIPHYTPDDFKAHFRMSRETFQAHLNMLIIVENNQDIDYEDFKKKLLFTVWVLAKQESFLSVGDIFNFSKSTGHRAFMFFTRLIAGQVNNIIVWPNQQERQRISRVCEETSGIPGIIGAIDGCHIPIKAPPHNANDYYNRNNIHSIILQGVCNDKKQFTDIYVGAPGRVHDARVFRNSGIFALLSGNNPPIEATEHLLGDAAYPLLPFLMKPYQDNGHLGDQQVTFNIRMSGVRSLIERTFGLLKGKFRRLKYIDMSLIEAVPMVITAACVLHNFIISSDLEGNLDEDDDELEENLEQNGMEQDGIDDPNLNIGRAEIKRQFLASLL